MRRGLKIFGIVTLIVVTGIGALLLNAYLTKNNLFIYATGTNDKAFLNATWKMSKSEIERANKTTLVPPIIDFRGVLATSITNLKRFQDFVQEDVTLWGHIAEVNYSFFDNQLYEYSVSLTTYGPEKLHEEILATLRGQFGDGKVEEKKRQDIIYSFMWDTEKQTISYWQTISKWMLSTEDKKTYRVGIKAVYKPFYRQIEDIAKNEKKGYF